MKVGFVGLGVMGFPMARHLSKSGLPLQLYNRSPAKTRAFIETHGGVTSDDPAKALAGADVAILCVSADADVREITGRILSELAPGAVIVDHSTTSADVAREMAEKAAAVGRQFVDAPVSGGQSGAEAGILTAMLGGDEAAIERITPVISAYCRTVRRIGPSGAGQLAKMCNQICIAGLVQGLSEAVHFAEQADLDAQAVFEAISMGAAGSWQMQNRWATMVDGKFDFGFAVDLMRKDLGLVLQAARTNGARLEVTALVDQFYAEVQAMGGRRWDTSSLVARLSKSTPKG
jgi:3-hydroxyisobutyrate dehydrogenase